MSDPEREKRGSGDTGATPPFLYGWTEGPVVFLNSFVQISEFPVRFEVKAIFDLRDTKYPDGGKGPCRGLEKGIQSL
jgi:hypothetical protein